MPYTQEQINAGQRKINGALVEVDRRVIYAFKEILAIVRTITALPPIAPYFKGFDFTYLEASLQEVSYENYKVAEITPPGCSPPPY
jgi:hypothetical protein